jgi:hypothetical protein
MKGSRLDGEQLSLNLPKDSAHDLTSREIVMRRLVGFEARQRLRKATREQKRKKAPETPREKNEGNEEWQLLGLPRRADTAATTPYSGMRQEVPGNQPPTPEHSASRESQGREAQKGKG